MKKAVFTVETISAGMGEVLVYVEDPAGHREEVRHRPCGRFLWNVVFYMFLVIMAYYFVNILKMSSRLK